MSETATAPAARASRWRDGMLWLLIGIVVMVVGTNAVMLFVAFEIRPDLVRRDYYEASKRVDDVRAARAASARLGWSATPLIVRGERAALQLRITDAQGRPVSGLTGSVQAYRPADATLDQTLTLREPPATPGTYRAEFARPAPGLWHLSLDLQRDEARFVAELPIVMP